MISEDHQQARSAKACAAQNDCKRTMKRAFGMPRGFFSLSWMMSGGVFEVDMLSFERSRDDRPADLISALVISRIGKSGSISKHQQQVTTLRIFFQVTRPSDWGLLVGLFTGNGATYTREPTTTNFLEKDPKQTLSGFAKALRQL
jgi:hypothetical protein